MSDEKDKDKEDKEKSDKKIISLRRDRKSDETEEADGDDTEYVESFEIEIALNGGYALRVNYNSGQSDLLLFETKDKLIDILKESLI
jgi:hypothetical protein